jgi:branched-subunit amino acid transport protein
MSAIWPIVGMGVGVYALRLAGFVPRRLRVPASWERALGFVPVALLTSLVVSNLAGAGESRPDRVVAAAVAVLVARSTGRMWACVLAGMVCLWSLRLV